MFSIEADPASLQPFRTGGQAYQTRLASHLANFEPVQPFETISQVKNQALAPQDPG